MRLWSDDSVDYSSFFFFQAEDGIRDLTVTGVQTCALPISPRPARKYQQLLPCARWPRGSALRNSAPKALPPAPLISPLNDERAEAPRRNPYLQTRSQRGRRPPLRRTRYRRNRLALSANLSERS